jgi:lipoprotein-anchoring transpeptidase ErfK/SrfK
VDRADGPALRRAWLWTQPPRLTLRRPAAGEEFTEGDEVELAWESAGPISFVRVSYSGERCRLGGGSRGAFSGTVAEHARNTGRLKWKIPWVDALSLTVQIAGLSDAGRKLAGTEGVARFRPRTMRDLKEGTLLVVDKDRQRLYYQRDGKIIREHIISTAAGGYWTPSMRPGSYNSQRGAMGRVFSKDPDAYSRWYHCHMLWWLGITESGSHGIHATSPGFYDLLGGPASHGCIRQHRYDAAILYDLVDLGTPVYVFP